jgi:hypothetical protein
MITFREVWNTECVTDEEFEASGESYQANVAQL